MYNSTIRPLQRMGWCGRYIQTLALKLFLCKKTKQIYTKKSVGKSNRVNRSFIISHTWFIASHFTDNYFVIQINDPLIHIWEAHSYHFDQWTPKYHMKISYENYYSSSTLDNPPELFFANFKVFFKHQGLV